jgi:hypothetical protein
MGVPAADRDPRPPLSPAAPGAGAAARGTGMRAELEAARDWDGPSSVAAIAPPTVRPPLAADRSPPQLVWAIPAPARVGIPALLVFGRPACVWSLKP